MLAFNSWTSHHITHSYTQYVFPRHRLMSSNLYETFKPTKKLLGTHHTSEGESLYKVKTSKSHELDCSNDYSSFLWILTELLARQKGTCFSQVGEFHFCLAFCNRTQPEGKARLSNQAGSRWRSEFLPKIVGWQLPRLRASVGSFAAWGAKWRPLCYEWWGRLAEE